MPELPEVETTRRGIAPYLEGRVLVRVDVREPRLRWPVTSELIAGLQGARIDAIDRRGKYLMFRTARGTALAHLGMSGSLRIVPAGTPRLVHDHLELQTDRGVMLRYNDPRRFGCWLWAGGAPERHALLAALGPEPLESDFSGDHLWQLSRSRKTPVKSFIMDGRVVVGVGNIYANEALFLAGILPARAAGRIALPRYRLLAGAIRDVLGAAITQGGTTLRDFVGGDGRPGYFQQQLNVYGRGGEPCRQCEESLRERRLGQRSTVYCVACQR